VSAPFERPASWSAGSLLPAGAGLAGCSPEIDESITTAKPLPTLSSGSRLSMTCRPTLSHISMKLSHVHTLQ